MCLYMRGWWLVTGDTFFPGPRVYACVRPYHTLIPEETMLQQSYHFRDAG